LIQIKEALNRGASAFKGRYGRNEFSSLLNSINDDITEDLNKIIDSDIKTALGKLKYAIEIVLVSRKKSFEKDGEIIEYYQDFEKADIESTIKHFNDFLDVLGGIEIITGPNEDSPVPFNEEDLPNHLERLSQEQNVQQYLDFMVMRIRTMLADGRMSSILSSSDSLSLEDWLKEYIGDDGAANGEIAIIDLSIVPQEILHIVVAVISRIVFEALQRYRRMYGETLPTVIVMEEAHNFIGRYFDDGSFSPARLCTESFERIAKEGRKFGLGLMLSSQRPSELSSTVLSQCNTFLLHRIVNDKDQELVKKLVPDSLGGLLNELPILPTRKAILLGWAAPLPILVEMKELQKDHRPHSHDPDFWKVWTNQIERKINWKEIADEWQLKTDENDNE
jgi:hypothetical protein